MSIQCWYYDVEDLSRPEAFERGMARLAWEDRREKVLRLRFERDRRLCLGAGLLAADALRRAGAEDLRVVYGENGKPALLRHPDIHFSLSHSGRFAVCAVSDEPVGADIERLRAVRPSMIARIFQPDERAWLGRARDPDRAFTRLWTRKESYLKLLGTGLTRPLDSFSVLPGADAADGPRFAEREVSEHLLCVCFLGRREVEFLEWEPEA